MTHKSKQQHYNFKRVCIKKHLNVRFNNPSDIPVDEDESQIQMTQIELTDLMATVICNSNKKDNCYYLGIFSVNRIYVQHKSYHTIPTTAAHNANVIQMIMKNK